MAASFYSQAAANRRKSFLLVLVIVALLAVLGAAIGYGTTGAPEGAIGWLGIFGLIAIVASLAGPPSPITYMRTEAYVEPYTDHERIGRLVFLRPGSTSATTSSMSSRRAISGADTVIMQMFGTIILFSRIFTIRGSCFLLRI